MLDADVSGAPVVDEEGHLMGVLTEKDLIWKVSRQQGRWLEAWWSSTQQLGVIFGTA